MTTLRRICACRTPIEAEPDEASIQHAVRVHQDQPEHRLYTVLQAVIDEVRVVSVPDAPTLRRTA